MGVESPKPVRDPEYHFREASLTPLRFEGKGAKILGIEGTFDRATYLNLYDGYTTGENGERNTRLPKYMHPDRRGAFEITVNLPKTVSIVNELGGDPRICDVMTRAREAVAKEVEKQARVRVTKQSEVEKSKERMPKGWRYPERKTENLVWVSHRHSTSRLQDVHSHDHLVFFNLSYDKQEKTWKAIELRYIDKPKLSKIYRDTVRQGLNELGYKTKAVGQEFEIVGVPAEVKATFSRRHTAIREIEADYEAKKGKPLTSKAKGKLSVYNRPEKAEDRPVADRRREWIAKLAPEHFRSVAGIVERAKRSVRNSRLKAAAQQYLGRFRQPEVSVGMDRAVEMER